MFDGIHKRGWEQALVTSEAKRLSPWPWRKHSTAKDIKCWQTGVSARTSASSCSLAPAGSGTNPGVACIDPKMQQLVSHISRQGLGASPALELCLNSWIWAKGGEVSLELAMYNCFTIDCLLEADIMIASQAPTLDWEGCWCSMKQKTEELWYTNFEQQ